MNILSDIKLLQDLVSYVYLLGVWFSSSLSWSDVSLMLMCIWFMEKKDYSFHSIILTCFLFIVELEPLILRDIIDFSWFLLFYCSCCESWWHVCMCMCACVCAFLLLFIVLRLFFSSVSIGIVNLLCLFLLAGPLGFICRKVLLH